VSDPLTAAGLARFAEVAASHVGADAVPGLVALVARGDQVHVEAMGSLSIGGPPVQRDSLFRISSTTKPVTGAATLALAREGLLTLDEPVERLLPELAGPRVLRRMDGPLDDTVPAERAITVRDLLTFTFGFGMAMEMFTAPQRWPAVTVATELHLATIGPPSPAEQPDPDTWIAALGSLPLLAQPGARWLYNTGASVLGVLLARAAGMPIADVLRTRVFEPLGMRDTSFWTADTARLATAYLPTADGLQVWDSPDGQWSRPPAFGDGAAGLVSTAADLLGFARMLLRGGAPVLAADAVTDDDPGPADARAANPGRERLSRRARLGILPVRRHRGAVRRSVRLGRRSGLLLAGRSGQGSHRDRVDPAVVRDRPNATGPPRPASRGVLRGRLTRVAVR
jgi:CubicO group peptidase (beta-lactamase class C family)